MGTQRVLIVNKERGLLDARAALKTIALWLQTCANGKYTIAMKRVQEKRSNPQNRLMWSWFTIIAQAWSEATGRTFTQQDVHDAYCLMFLPVDTPKGRIAGSTSSLSQEQMTEFLNNVQADAQTEYGIQLPSGEDIFFAELAAEYCNN
jgi:hypothetical protein